MVKRLCFKGVVMFMFVLISLIFLVGSVIAINLDVTSNPVSNSVITDLDEPGVFDLTIENKGEEDSFELYSLIGVDISPDSSYYIGSNGIKTIRVSVMPQKALQARKGFLTFEYILRNSKNEIQRETLTINIIDLGSVFEIIPDNVNPNAESVVVSIKNKVSRDFNNVNFKINSAFFDYEKKLSFEGLEIKEIRIPLGMNEASGLAAGSYLVNSIIEINDKSARNEVMIKFLEQEGIDSKESSEGWIKRRQEIINHNVGNVRKEVSIELERNILSSLFTSFNIEPSDSSFKGLKKSYVWNKELLANEEFKLVVITNWFYPIILILLIFGVLFFSKRFVSNDIILKKNVSFVKTKGGQFALKVIVRVKSKRFVERIKVIDKLPHLVKLYEKFGAISPSEIDLKNRRLEWNIESLNAGEERVFSYIIYSKVGVIGRFELPSARSIYEKEGRVKEVNSNRCFFINEPSHG